MTEMFIGKMKAGKKEGNVSGKVRLLKEGEVVFEAVEGSNKIKAILSNSEDVSKGEELMLSEVSPPMPSPKFEVYKYRKA